MVGRGDGTTYVTLVGRYAALDRVCVVGRRRGRGALWGVCGDVVSQRFTRSVRTFVLGRVGMLSVSRISVTTVLRNASPPIPLYRNRSAACTPLARQKDLRPDGPHTSCPPQAHTRLPVARGAEVHRLMQSCKVRCRPSPRASSAAAGRALQQGIWNDPMPSRRRRCEPGCAAAGGGQRRGCAAPPGPQSQRAGRRRT